MKKQFISTPFLYLFFLLIVISCKKDFAPSPDNDQIIKKINTWIDWQKSNGKPSDNAKLDTIKNHLDFSSLRYESLNENEKFIVIPITNFLRDNNRDKNSVNILLLTMNDTGIVRGNIVQYNSTDHDINKKNKIPINTFSKIYNNKNIDCGGEFVVLAVTGNFKYLLNYQNGKIQSYGLMKDKSVPNPSGKILQCYETYLVTYYSDGSETWQYLFTWCDNDQCNETRQINGRSYKIDCGGGGGGGSSETCCIPLDQNIQLTTDHAISDEQYICNSESVDPNTGIPIKSCTFQWTYSTNHLLFYTWKFQSIELTNLEKISGVWKFKTDGLTHNGQTQSGTIPPCTTFSSTISSAVATVNPGLTTGRMNLIVTEQFNVTCCPWCSPSYSNFSVSAAVTAQQ